MRRKYADVWSALFMGLILPGMLLNTIVFLKDKRTEPAVQEVQKTESVPLEMKLLMPDGTGMILDLDDYLVRVVLGEMPANFDIEALKAQAVAARTFTRKAWVTGGKHGDGSVCTSSRCCQAYITEQRYLDGGGTEENLEKVRAAVTETSGEVLTYDGELIEAVYFSCSGGSTEDAAAVWGVEYPYLKSVDSPGEEGAAVYWDLVSFSTEEFQEALGVSLSGDADSWFGKTLYTKGGGVGELEIGGVRYDGTQLRSLLGLRSTIFSVETEGNIITFTTRGYGHRVGMSQYGAEAMAVAGGSYEDILSHYYPGTVLTKIDREGNLL